MPPLARSVSHVPRTALRLPLPLLILRHLVSTTDYYAHLCICASSQHRLHIARCMLRNAEEYDHLKKRVSSDAAGFWASYAVRTLHYILYHLGGGVEP